MATSVVGRQAYRGSRDEQGYRTYHVKWLVKGGLSDGPANVMATPGLPLVGSLWLFDDDVDVWCWCRPNAEVQLHNEKEGEKTLYWTVEQQFSNKPLPFALPPDPGNGGPTDPLLEPPKVSGQSVRYSQEVTHDRLGRRITNSAWEQVRGDQVEFDFNRPQITIEFNVGSLDLALYTLAVDTVNDAPLWGLQPRMIKLSDFSWEKIFYNLGQSYYKARLVFDIRYDTFDRFALDEGTKVLRGRWRSPAGTSYDSLWELETIAGSVPDPDNPQHFMRYVDAAGNPTKVILDGKGHPAGSGFGIPITAIDPAGSTTLLMTTSAAHALTAGDTVNVLGSRPPYFDATYEVLTTPSATTFTVTSPVDSPDVYTGGGYVYAKGSGPGVISIQVYPESNFLALGIPTTF